ncbi:hypothetical protein KIPB_016167, partial [Kipferlia bialata]
HIELSSRDAHVDSSEQMSEADIADHTLTPPLSVELAAPPASGTAVEAMPSVGQTLSTEPAQTQWTGLEELYVEPLIPIPSPADIFTTVREAVESSLMERGLLLSQPTDTDPVSYTGGIDPDLTRQGVQHLHTELRQQMDLEDSSFDTSTVQGVLSRLHTLLEDTIDTTAKGRASFIICRI